MNNIIMFRSCLLTIIEKDIECKDRIINYYVNEICKIVYKTTENIINDKYSYINDIELGRKLVYKIIVRQLSNINKHTCYYFDFDTTHISNNMYNNVVTLLKNVNYIHLFQPFSNIIIDGIKYKSKSRLILNKMNYGIKLDQKMIDKIDSLCSL